MNAKQWIVVVVLSIAAILYFCLVLLPLAFPSEQKQDSGEPNEPSIVVGTNYTDVSFAVSDERTGEDDYAGEWELSDADHYYPLQFSYQHKAGNREVDFELIDGEVVCNKSPEEAIEIIFLCLHRYYGRFVECTVPIRFPEPEEPCIIHLEPATIDLNYEDAVKYSAESEEPNEVHNLNCSHVSGYCTLCRKPPEPEEPCEPKCCEENP